MYRTLLTLLAVVAVLTVVVRLLRTNWRSAGAQAGDIVKERAADLSSHSEAWRDKAAGVLSLIHI